MAGLLSPVGLEGLPFGGELRLVGGWKGWSYGLGSGVYYVAFAQPATVFLVRPSLFLGFTFWDASFLSLSIELGAAAELFWLSDEQRSAFRWRFGGKGSLRFTWVLGSRFSTFLATSLFFSPLQMVLKAKQNKDIYRTRYAHLDIMLGLRVRF